MLARPLVLRLSGAGGGPPLRFRVTAGFDYKKRANRCEYVRARLVARRPRAAGPRRNSRADGAGILTSMIRVRRAVELGEGVSRVAAGSAVEFLPFSEVIP